MKFNNVEFFFLTLLLSIYKCKKTWLNYQIRKLIFFPYSTMFFKVQWTMTLCHSFYTEKKIKKKIVSKLFIFSAVSTGRGITQRVKEWEKNIPTITIIFGPISSFYLESFLSKNYCCIAKNRFSFLKFF